MNTTTLALDVATSLGGRVALVTGGMGGIGRATVDVLRGQGCRVAFTYAPGIDDPAAVQERLAAAPEQLSAHALDLRDPASIRRCLDAALEHWGRVDILVNNAAVGSATVRAYADDAGEQDSAMLAINADGTLKMCQHYLLRMRGRVTGQALKIINISSVGGGITAFPGFRLSDGMSKAAVAFLTRQLAAELTDCAIDVFALCPGATNTPMFQASTLAPMSEPERQAFLQRLPRQRLIEPVDIARIIAFLASACSSPLHGAVIDASMGLGVRPGLMTEHG